MLAPNALPSLLEQGYVLDRVALPDEVRHAVLARDWLKLDREIGRATSPGGPIFECLRKYRFFTSIEFIISIRSSLEAPDEDGIWHDDGSRVLAFSLSLTLAPERLEGGVLELRKRFQSPPAPARSISTPPYGTMIVFATGQDGFEHKINRVAQGERIIIAGWCT